MQGVFLYFVDWQTSLLADRIFIHLNQRKESYISMSAVQSSKSWRQYNDHHRWTRSDLRDRAGLQTSQNQTALPSSQKR